MFSVIAVSDADQLPASGMGSTAVTATAAATIMNQPLAHHGTHKHLLWTLKKARHTHPSILINWKFFKQHTKEIQSHPELQLREKMASQTSLTMR